MNDATEASTDISTGRESFTADVRSAADAILHRVQMIRSAAVSLTKIYIHLLKKKNRAVISDSSILY